MEFKESGAPERIRTSDPQIRSLVLYPAELRVPWTGAAPEGGARRKEARNLVRGLGGRKG